jgi:hypothetical protein
MNKRNRENLAGLFGRFFGVSEAEAAAEEVRAAERILDAYPAPEPDARSIAAIKMQIITRLARKRTVSRAIHRSMVAAAAVVVVAIIGLLGRGPTGQSDMDHAAIIPTRIWESDDIASDDLELVYFNAEIERIEAQMRALESGEGEGDSSSTLGEIEIELMQIESEFWKG